MAWLRRSNERDAKAFWISSSTIRTRDSILRSNPSLECSSMKSFRWTLAYPSSIEDTARQSEACRRLVEIPGIGPLIDTAVTAAVRDEARFSSGRHFAAWLGVTPKQHSSGGKARPLGISKRGDAYMGRQFVNGACSLVRIADGRSGGIWDWKGAGHAIMTASISSSLASRQVPRPMKSSSIFPNAATAIGCVPLRAPALGVRLRAVRMCDRAFALRRSAVDGEDCCLRQFSRWQHP